MERTFKIKEILTSILIAISSIGIQFLIIKMIPQPVILIVLELLLGYVLISITLIKNLNLALILLYFLPLLYLNNEFQYAFRNEILMALPLLILVFIAISNFILKESSINLNKHYLSKPILIFVLYFFVEAVLGILKGYGVRIVLIETFHFSLYLSVYVFYYLFTTKEDFIKIFKLLFVVFFLISIEYIFYGTIGSGVRFVTFQSGFLPFFSGMVFSFLLFSGFKTNKIFYTIILIITLLGIYATLTRSIWISVFFVLLIVLFLYVKSEGKLTKVKLALFVAFIFVPVFIVFTNLGSKGRLSTTTEMKNPKYRAESIANPTKDISFLMRLELSWFAVQKFIKEPLIGSGLGDYLRYKILGNYQLKNHYIDNSWLYFLWKGGIIGFMLAIWIFYRALKISFYILNKTEDQFVKTIIVGVIAGIIGTILLAFVSPLLIKYRTNILFPLLFVYLEYEYFCLNKLSPKELYTLD